MNLYLVLLTVTQDGRRYSKRLPVDTLALLEWENGLTNMAVSSPKGASHLNPDNLFGEHPKRNEETANNSSSHPPTHPPQYSPPPPHNLMLWTLFFLLSSSAVHSLVDSLLSYRHLPLSSPQVGTPASNSWTSTSTQLVLQHLHFFLLSFRARLLRFSRLELVIYISRGVVITKPESRVD